ncbi:hypothetical protein PR001_g33983, partial [Phytophthora rubi]
IESVAKALQGLNVDLLDVQQWFDELMSAKPQLAHYLGPRANIVHSPDFESGCVRVLRGKSGRLNRAEKAALQSFATTRSSAEPDNAADVSTSFVERLRKRRRLAEAAVAYEQLRSVAHLQYRGAFF